MGERLGLHCRLYRENIKKRIQDKLAQNQLQPIRMQSLLPKMRLMRRISFLSRPVSGILLSRPVHFGLARRHLSSSIILSGRKRRESRKETATETENDDSVTEEDDIMCYFCIFWCFGCVFGLYFSLKYKEMPK